MCIILQHLLHLNSLIFITRTSTVGLTGLPQPNPKCVDQQHLPVSFGKGLTICHTDEFVQSHFLDGNLIVRYINKMATNGGGGVVDDVAL